MEEGVEWSPPPPNKKKVNWCVLRHMHNLNMVNVSSPKCNIFLINILCCEHGPPSCQSVFMISFGFLISGLTRIMSTSRDYDELLWAWQSWRDEVGPSAKDDYIRYVELKNEAAEANGKIRKIITKYLSVFFIIWYNNMGVMGIPFPPPAFSSY